MDEGVPDFVGRCFEEAGHHVIYLNRTTIRASPDPVVCAVAEEHEAILVAFDADMRTQAHRRGVGKRRFRTLSLIKLSCRESRAAERLRCAMSLIEHEWTYGAVLPDRRLFIEIMDSVIRTIR